MDKAKAIILISLIPLIFIGCMAFAYFNPDVPVQETTTYSVEFTSVADITTEIETTTEPTTEEPTTEAPLFADYEIEALCKMVYGEAGTSPREQKRWVAIVALNHYDRHCNGGYTLWEIVTDRNQFVGYSASHPVTSEIREIVEGVIQDYPTKTNWVDFYYFNSVGDGINNYFH